VLARTDAMPVGRFNIIRFESIRPRHQVRATSTPRLPEWASAARAPVSAQAYAEVSMPERKTIRRARKDLREGKSPSTAAGEFVREEMDLGEGKHGDRSAKQAIAIGLSKARRAGVPLKPHTGEERTRRATRRAYEMGRGSRT